MVKCRVEWLPTDNEKLVHILDQLAPYILSSYGEDQIREHGELSFDFPLWLQMWDARSGFFVTAWDGDRLVGTAMCVKYRPLMYARIRIDVDRVVADTPEIATAIEEYIVGIADVLNTDEIYRVKYTAGTETKERIYGSR